MKYEKCPICEEKLRNGVCPMCGYDFNRLGRSRILKDGHWDILTTDKKTSQPKYIHDEKRHPDFKNIKNTKTQSMKTQRKTSTYKNKKKRRDQKRKVGGDCLCSLSVVIFSRSCTRGIHSHRRFYKSDPEWIKFLKKVSKSLSFFKKKRTDFCSFLYFKKIKIMVTLTL